jgi:hypothetical protein
MTDEGFEQILRPARLGTQSARDGDHGHLIIDDSPEKPLWSKSATGKHHQINC